MNNNIVELSIRQLLSADNYRIPIYQRNYAWRIPEVTQLVQDIADYAKNASAQNYYIGNLIVFPRHDDNNNVYYETIDGQQRTTTLTILMCALRHQEEAKKSLGWYNKINISFDHRNKSNTTLTSLYDGMAQTLDDDDINPDILNVYDSTWTIISKICGENKLSIDSFVSYFLEKVKILRISVPQGTNLNHYFEIMNSRGEQLEQHEIVKALLMRPLQDKPFAMATFNLIWEACSDMDRYVQMNFSPTIRNLIFNNSGSGDLILDFEDIENILMQQQYKDDDDVEEKSLMDLFSDSRNSVKYRKPWEDRQDVDFPENFTSQITFPNFLLQVAKIIDPNNEKIVLDDKRLTTVFTLFENDKDYTVNFIMSLLRLRVYFDKYVIKRKQAKWTLQTLTPSSDKKRYYYKGTFEDEDKNRNIALLLSMFHVSTPTQNYKWWLFAVLKFVNDRNGAVTADEYIAFLENLAKAYMLDHYLSGDSVDFDVIVIKNKGIAKNILNNVNWANINIGEYPQIGEKIENFVFNYYDYLLLKESKDSDFEYAVYRNAVEHFYPQHPVDGREMDFNHLHSFGNLSLINRRMNSRFTNSLPRAKAVNFGNDEAIKTYSMKLKDMITCANSVEWDEQEIEEKEQEAKVRISKALKD